MGSAIICSLRAIQVGGIPQPGEPGGGSYFSFLSRAKFGCAGPLVYPAAHLFIYNALYLLTDKGTDIFVAQCIFAVVYLGTLNVAMACYRMAKVWLAMGKIGDV